MESFLVFLAILAHVALSSVPGIVAFNRGHRNAAAIMLCGYILWPAALIWSLTDNVEPRKHSAAHRRISRKSPRRRTARAARYEDDADALAELIDS